MRPGRAVAAAMVRAAQRGVTVRVLVDGWGARLYLTPSLAQMLAAGGVRLMKYRPEVAPWQFRLHRLRRLHRKICHVDGRVAFVGGINLIDDMNTPRHKPPRVDFAVRVEGPMLAPIVMSMQRLWALVELTQFDRSDVPLFPVADPDPGRGNAGGVVRHPRQPGPPPRHRGRLPGRPPDGREGNHHRDGVFLSRVRSSGAR